MVANATKNGVVGINNFDNIYPWSNIKSYNYNVQTKQITAWYGDVNFDFDGSNGEVLTYIPEFYYKRNISDGYEYIYISAYPHDGYIKSEPFSVGRYKASLADGKLHSISGKNPSTNLNITQHRNYARALGTGFGQMDWRYSILEMLYLVEYADYNAQVKLGYGWTNLPYTETHKALISEINTNRIVIASNFSSLYQVGWQVDIGTSRGGRQVIKDRTITSIEDYDDGTVTGVAISFDGAAVNISEGNMLYCCGQKSGYCDTLGMKSGSVGLGNSYKEGVIYRGIEDFFGNVSEWVDSINVRNNQAWVCKKPAEYDSNKFATPYEKLGYMNSSSSGYTKEFGYDPKYPEIALTTKIGASYLKNSCDYYSQNPGDRIVCVGATIAGGVAAGPFYWHVFYPSSFEYFICGARILKYQ